MGAVCPHGPKAAPRRYSDQKKGKIIRTFAIILALVAGPAWASEFAVPSGRTFALYDVRIDDDLGRFRFVLPEIATGATFADVVDDIEYVCAQIAVPALTQANSSVTQLVISVSAEEVPFGEATQVIQYFQPFRREGDACIWEEF